MEECLPTITQETSRNDEIPVSNETEKLNLPVLNHLLENAKTDLKSEFSYGESSSLRLPSLSSLYDLEDLGSHSSDYEYEDAVSGFSINSSFEDNFEGNLLRDSKSRRMYSAVLEDQEEKEIARRVKKEFKQEFQKIKKEKQEKQRFLRKKFQSKINLARGSLLLARMNAEKKAIIKLKENAEKKEMEILEKRKERRHGSLTNQPNSTMGYTAFEIGALRNLRAQLDRARARRRSTIASTLIASRHFSIGMALPDYETKRLENVEEVQKLVSELQSLGLESAAHDLVRSVHNKKSAEEQLKETLKQEREYAKEKAITKRDMEIEKLRKQKLEEKEMIERERVKREKEERERLEKELLRRKMEALKRKAFNMKLRRSLEETKLAGSISRSYTYSYF